MDHYFLNEQTNMKRIVEIGPGFYNIRANFYYDCTGIINFGTHMSIIKLDSGRFVIIDTVGIDNDLKAEIDTLTQNGQLIEAVIATHPFHTTYFPAFYKLYPQLKYIGTPRHLRIQPEIKWATDVSQDYVLRMFEPEINMRIADGSEFVNPDPDNHFNNVFVYHPKSKTLHCDDTLMYFNNPGCLFGCCGGVKANTIYMHLALTTVGLKPDVEAPNEFKRWIFKMMDDWDFENLVVAHNGTCIGGAKDTVMKTLLKIVPLLEKMVQDRKERQQELSRGQTVEGTVSVNPM